MNKRERGFTLVEVVVVLVILAVLAAFLIPSLTGYVDKAQVSACKSASAQMRRFYLAAAAMHRHTEAEAQACLAEAAEVSGFQLDGDGAYICPGGGRCEVEYSDGCVQLAGITCSLHGLVWGAAATYTLDQIGESFGDSIAELGSAMPNRDVYSTSSDPALLEQVLAGLPEGMRDSLEGKVWTLKYISYWSSYELIVFDGVVDELPASREKVPVMVYSPTAEPHVREGTRYVATRSVGGAQVKILEPNDY